MGKIKAVEEEVLGAIYGCLSFATEWIRINHSRLVNLNEFRFIKMEDRVFLSERLWLLTLNYLLQLILFNHVIGLKMINICLKTFSRRLNLSLTHRLYLIKTILLIWKQIRWHFLLKLWKLLTFFLSRINLLIPDNPLIEHLKYIIIVLLL